ncbi:MAG: hypothetical protein H6679_03940 [Epsilonproteobacteria bacterium]|nr:hypothetical protein [Campylobacterota bacterium]
MKLHNSLVFIYLFVCGSVFAAGPYTHVYLTQKWINKNRASYNEPENVAQKRACLLGGMWPDIRYILKEDNVTPVITRKQTHERGLTAENLRACQDACELGKKIHCFIDEKREEFARKEGIRDLLFKKNQKLPQKMSDRYLKFLEDEVLFDMQGQWDDFLWTENFMADGEIVLGLTERDVRVWHEKLRLVFANRPSKLLSLVKGKTYFGISPTMLEVWYELMPDFSGDQEIQSYVKRMLIHLEQLF